MYFNGNGYTGGRNKFAKSNKTIEAYCFFFGIVFRSVLFECVMIWHTLLLLLQKNIQNLRTMTKDCIERYVWMVEMLRMYGCLTLKQFNKLWEGSSLNYNREKGIPRRTFFRHKEAIERMFGIRIAYIPHSGYTLAEDDPDMPGHHLRNWLLESLSIGVQLKECENLEPSIILEDIPSCQTWLCPIMEALRNERMIRIRYHKFNASETEFDAHPYCLKLFRQRWYLLARKDFSDTPRVFSLDRITSAVILGKKRDIPASFDPKAWFHDFYGVFVYPDRTPQRILLKVFSSRVPYYRTLPLHSSQEEILKTPLYSIFQFWLVPTLDFLQEILSAGSLIEVLEPSSFRASMKSEIDRMSALYKDGKE